MNAKSNKIEIGFANKIKKELAKRNKNKTRTFYQGMATTYEHNTHKLLSFLSSSAAEQRIKSSPMFMGSLLSAQRAIHKLNKLFLIKVLH